jgi:hypothetical protein
MGGVDVCVVVGAVGSAVVVVQEGANHLFPDRWEAYVAPIPEAERHDLVTAYRKRLVGSDDEVRALNRNGTANLVFNVALAFLFKRSF